MNAVMKWILVLGSLALLALPGSLTGPARAAEGVVDDVAAPPMGHVIDVWVDAVDNHEPAIAYNSKHGEYLVVWWNDRGATRDISARRVTGDGVLKSSFTVISDANKWNWLPDVAYSPTQDEFLVVYAYAATASDYDIYARRIKWDGSWMSGEIAVNLEGDKQWYPAVAYNSQNNEYLVVYENYWSGGLRDIAAQRIRASDGALLSWRNIASSAATVRRLPDVAYNATRNEYLIAYTYQYPSDGDIRGKVASANLGTLSSELAIVDNTSDQDGVALAAGPNEYLAVWGDGPSSTHRTVYGRRITGAGTLQPYIPIIDQVGVVNTEVAVGYGPVYGYLVSWRHIYSASDWDIYGRYVKGGQNVGWGVEYSIDSSVYHQRSPAAACSRLGDCLVVYEDNRPGADYEIRGRIARAGHAYLPQVRRSSGAP